VHYGTSTSEGIRYLRESIREGYSPDDSGRFEFTVMEAPLETMPFDVSDDEAVLVWAAEQVGVEPDELRGDDVNAISGNVQAFRDVETNRVALAIYRSPETVQQLRDEFFGP